MKLISALIFLSYLAAGVVFCQAPPDSVIYPLAPVTVTATRVPASWFQLPLALSVVPVNGALSGKGYGLDELLSSIPGVLAQSRYGNQDIRLTIRGFGARGAGARSNAGTARGIRVLVDGFPETEPDGRTSFDLVDLSGAGRIEVIRSNASALWGNASGGILSVVSNTDFASPFADAGSIVGSFGFRKEVLHAGAMLGAGRFFLSVNNSNSTGWRDHSGSTQALFNTGILSPLGERTSLGVYVTGTNNLFHVPGPLTQAQYDSSAPQANADFVQRDERRVNRLGRIGVSVSHDIDGNNTVSAATFINTKNLQRSERNRFRDFNRYHVGGNAMVRNRTSFSPEISNTLAAGIDEAYQDGAIHFYNLVNGERGSSLIANKREGANNFGAFLQDELSFGEHVTATLGGRYDDISYYYDDYISPQLDDQRSFERFTPKAGLTYRFSPTHSVYANLGGGVEVPAGNEVDPAPTFGQDTVRALNPLLDAITSNTFEIGTKHIAAPGDGSVTLKYDAALYYVRTRNDIIPYDGGAFYFTAGETRRMGVELGGEFDLGNGLSFGTALTASKNEYAEYLVDSVHYGNPGKFANYKDNSMSGVPDFFYSVRIRYSPPMLDELYGRINVHGVGSYAADDANRFSAPAYTIVDLLVGLEHLRLGESRLFLNGFVGVNNLTDRKYVSSVWINPDLLNGVPVYLEPGLPLNVVGSISLGLNF